ncbi:MAG: hypothetical protein J5486_02920 [Bacteroidaceae bacterium]|nr:hypothetical protein [Bacteroidaceae bacterium]
MKQILITAALLIASMISTTAKELVVTLKDGTRMAFHIDSHNEIWMFTHSGERTVRLRTTELNIDNIKEMRIYSQLPSDVQPDAVQELPATNNTENGAVYDLSGRQVGTDLFKMKAGLYIVNNKKVVIP